MAKTLPLGRSSWDLVLDSSGNLVLADADTSMAQDVASAIRTFLGECWYDTTLGIPYFQAILGKLPARSLVVDKIVTAALTVPDVAEASVTFLGIKDRAVTGTVQVTSSLTSTTTTVAF